METIKTTFEGTYLKNTGLILLEFGLKDIPPQGSFPRKMGHFCVAVTEVRKCENSVFLAPHLSTT